MSRDPMSAPRGLLRLIILSLASKTPVSGVEIQRSVSEMTKGVWSPSPGSIYYILNELESKKMVTRIPVKTSGPYRYHVTEKGVEVLACIKGVASESARRSVSFAQLLARTAGLDFEAFVLEVALAALVARQEERVFVENTFRECAVRLKDSSAS